MLTSSCQMQLRVLARTPADHYSIIVRHFVVLCLSLRHLVKELFARSVRPLKQPNVERVPQAMSLTSAHRV